MIVQRMSIRAKPARRDEVVDLLKAERAKWHNPGSVRILVGGIGQAWNTVVEELTFENLAEYERGWKEWGSRPSMAEFAQKWNQVVDDWSDEIWEIVV